MISSLTPYLGWRKTGRGKAPFLAFVGTVALSYLISFLDGSVSLRHSSGIACLALGLGYALLGAVDFIYLCDHDSVQWRASYLTVQGLLLLGILWTSRLSGEIPICVYPLLGAIVALLPARWAALGTALLYGMILAVEDRFYGTHAMGRWALSLLPSFGFVIVFTQLAIQANRARERAEALSAEVQQLAVIQERNRLAREIHDSLGHFLTTIHVQLQAALAIHSKDSNRALEAVAQARDLSREALVEVRRSVGALQVDFVAAPLPVRLRHLVDTTDGWGAAVSLEIDGEIRSVAVETEHALFRAAQEGLTNVQKHARAQTARVLLNYRDPGVVSVRVVDNGQGRTTQISGHGLTGLSKRVVGLGGRVSAESSPGGGFCLQVEIPG